MDQNVKLIHFSVYKRGTRTTAGAENFNGQINKRFKTHGNFFHFVESMQIEEVAICEQLENDINGTIQKSNTSKFYIKRNKLIKKYSRMLEGNDLDPTLFLKIMSNEKNKISQWTEVHQ